MALPEVANMEYWPTLALGMSGLLHADAAALIYMYVRELYWGSHAPLSLVMMYSTLTAA